MRATGKHDWHPASPGPIVVLCHPNQVPTLLDELRPVVVSHPDSVWVHPRPLDGNSAIASIGVDLLNALAVVGLHPPPASGETHLLRPLVHLFHGPVRNVVIHDAALFDIGTHLELHQVALVANVQLWLVVDTAEDALRSTGLLTWVNDACTVIRPDQALALWRDRGTPQESHDAPEPSWWRQPTNPTDRLPVACQRHAVEGRVSCFLEWARYAIGSGHATPTMVRARLNEWLQHPDAVIADQWAATAAHRDFFNGGGDALAQLHPDASKARLSDVAPDGSQVWLRDGTMLEVEPMKRTALARLRLSRRLAGCLDSAAVVGFFDDEYGMRRRSRR